MKSKKGLTIAFSIFLLTLSLYASQGDIYHVSVPPLENEQYISADYSLWVPDAEMVRGIIVHQHGCGRNGIEMPHDIQWKALAEKWDCALMGTHYATDPPPCVCWNDPNNGSERAFLKAIEKFSEQSNHPELVDVPWAVWGHSGGAHWTTRMLSRFPERFIAAFVRSGGVGDFPDAVNEVPVMFNAGQRESEGRFQRVWNMTHECFSELSEKGGPVSLMIDPDASHDCGYSRFVAIPFFDACLAMRLSKTAADQIELKKIDKSKGWYGDNRTFDIKPVNQHKGDTNDLSWLPSENVAKKWREFVKTGWVTDTTPPEKPTHLKAKLLADNKVEITFNAKADFESSIKTFYLYRNGTKIAEHAGTANDFLKKKVFQGPDYGDEPIPPKVEYKLIDPNLPSGRMSTYQVTTINYSHLESDKSEPLLIKIEKTNHGNLLSTFFIGSLTNIPVRYNIFIPDDYYRSVKKLPVMYHLHGLGGDENANTQIVVETYEKALSDGVAGPMLIVFPNGHKNSMWADSKDRARPAETNVIKELIPHIDRTYRTKADRYSRIIQGMSMGGFGAVEYALKFPDMFSICINFDGALHNWNTLSSRRKKIADEIFSNDRQYFKQYSPWASADSYRSRRERYPVQFKMIVGALKEYNSGFHEYLVNLGIEAEYRLTPCGHNLRCLLNETGMDNFAFIETRMKR